MAKDNSNKLNLISNKISKDLSRTEYEKAIDFFNDTNSYMMINDINLSIKEMIDLINNNDRLREMIIVVFNSNLNDILEGNFSKFENNNFLMNLMVVYYMLSNYNAYTEVDEFEQEIDKLSPEMKKYYKYVSSIKRLSNKEEQVLIKRMKNNDKEAKKIIIESYLKVVFQLAYVFCKSSNEYSFEDLIQDANVELVNAVEKYDWENGRSFYNYLRACIESRLNKVCMNYSNPFYIHKTEESLSNFKNDYIKMNGRKPSIKEINGFIYTQSYDLENDILIKTVIEKLSLSENQRRVITLKYGLDNGIELTCEEVGEMLGVSRQRVQQLDSAGLDKLCRSLFRKRRKECLLKNPQKVEEVKAELVKKRTSKS